MIIFTTFEENIINMRLKYFKVSKLHGYLNKDIKFFDGVNLIVGINGSGKTSVLNMINWMLTPDLGHLCITHFKEAKLEFEYNKKQYVIKCWQDKDFLRYSITLNETEYHPLEVKLIADNSSIRFGASRENLLQHYIGLRPESKEVETWNLISKLPSPKIVGLDRFAENFNRSFPYEIFRDEEDFELFKRDIEDCLKYYEFSIQIEADIELLPSQINENLIKQLNAINRISGTGFPPIKVLVRTDDYEVSTFTTKKHLKVIDNETRMLIVKWNCMDWQTLNNDKSLMAVGTLSTPYYGRQKYTQLAIDEYTQQND